MNLVTAVTQLARPTQPQQIDNVRWCSTSEPLANPRALRSLLGEHEVPDQFAVVDSSLPSLPTQAGQWKCSGLSPDQPTCAAGREVAARTLASLAATRTSACVRADARKDTDTEHKPRLLSAALRAEKKCTVAKRSRSKLKLYTFRTFRFCCIGYVVRSSCTIMYVKVPPSQ